MLRSEDHVLVWCDEMMGVFVRGESRMHLFLVLTCVWESDDLCAPG